MWPVTGSGQWTAFAIGPRHFSPLQMYALTTPGQSVAPPWRCSFNSFGFSGFSTTLSPMTAEPGAASWVHFAVNFLVTLIQARWQRRWVHY